MDLFIYRFNPNATFNITRSLDNDSSIILAQETEREAFVRAVDDVHVRFSNLDGLAKSIFGTDLPASVEWRLYIVEGAGIRFHGIVDKESIEFDPLEEWCDFDAFSLLREVWERCGQVKIVTRPFDNLEKRALYTTLSVVAERQLRHAGCFGSATALAVLHSADFGVFASKRIRGWADGTAIDLIGNEGRFRELDPQLTVKDFLEGVALYYNAEFYVDYNGAILRMVARNTALSQIFANIDGALVQDSQASVAWSNTRPYDHLRVLSTIERPPTPILVTIVERGGNGLFKGLYRFVITAMVGNDESAPGFVLDVTVATGGGPIITVPAMTDAAVTARRLYRSVSGGRMVLVAEISGNSPATNVEVTRFSLILDRLVYSSGPATYTATAIQESGADLSAIRPGDIIASPQQAPPSKNATVVGVDDVIDIITVDQWIVAGEGSPTTPPANGDRFEAYEITELVPTSQVPNSVWISFNHSTGTWNTPVFEREGTEPPIGKIFDTVPAFQFMPAGSLNGDLLPLRAFDIASFFGRDLTFNGAQDRYADLLFRHERAILKIDRTNLKVGDTVLVPKAAETLGLSGRTIFLVKRTAIDLIEEETELTMIRI